MVRPTLVIASAAAVVHGSVPGFTPSDAPNMNGEYPFAPMPGGKPGLFPKAYRDYPGGAEYYEVVSEPMTTLYSQVWWTPLAPMPFPEEMVKKYAGRKVAIVGWEIDQVRNGTDGVWRSVPISASYNHHYTAQVIGAAARFERVRLSGPDDPRAAEVARGGHGAVQFDQPHYVARPRNAGNKGAALRAEDRQTFSNANGGEFRKTYHGYAPGYAIVVDSPTALQVSPMAIDTWNRDKMDIDGPRPPRFVPGPLPRASEAPTDAPMYSGLLECPLTTRTTKVIDGAYTLVRDARSGAGACGGHAIVTSQECFHAAAATLSAGGANALRFANATGEDEQRPAGCSVTADADPAQPLLAHVFFNKLGSSTAPCGGGGGGGADAAVVEGASAPASLGGAVRVGVSLSPAQSTATITLTGPADVWFGVGFGATSMADRPWTLIAEGGAGGAVSERRLGGPSSASHSAGDALAPSVTVLSDTTSAPNNTRTLVLSRALEGAAGVGYYSFNASEPALPFIAAIGTGAKLAAHRSKVPARLTLLPVGARAAGACVCPQQPAAFGAATGTIQYSRVANQSADVGTGSSSGFGRTKVCKPFPATELLEQRNPTCDIRHYRGGQWACHHMWSLLDADQEIPWADQPLVLHHKWRLWVQPYNESYHTPVTYGFGTELLLGSPYEYDVPDCKAAPTPAGCARDPEFGGNTWIHTVRGNTLGLHHFTALNFHCHAPTCLSMAVYACDKAVALADCNATVGRLVCEEKPVYGGTGAAVLNGTRFDETGYIAIPQCTWGAAEFGLTPPPDLTGVPLHIIKKANATWPHTGEMAGGQPWVYV